MGSNDNELRLPQASPAGDKSQDHRRDRMKLLFISPPRVVSLWIHQVSYLIDAAEYDSSHLLRPPIEWSCVLHMSFICVTLRYLRSPVGGMISSSGLNDDF